jgi:SAM-dependent methyltransferase
VALAEAAPLPAASIDLVTVAQAAHWLRLDRFFGEARRVLRPKGVVALWAYALCTVARPVDRVLRRFYFETVGAYWPPERALVESLYRDLPFPFEEIPCPPQHMEHEWTREELVGYASTWSAVKRYREDRGEDPVDTLLSPKLRALWPDGVRALVRWPIGLRLGRVS